MSTLGKTWTAAVDTPEQIQMCLHCERIRCVDCIGRRLPPPREEFNRKSIGYRRRMLNATAREVINLYRTATSDKDIAEKMGRPLSTVTSVRRKFDLPPIRHISEADRNMLADEWLNAGA